MRWTLGWALKGDFSLSLACHEDKRALQVRCADGGQCVVYEARGALVASVGTAGACGQQGCIRAPLLQLHAH